MLPPFELVFDKQREHGGTGAVPHGSTGARGQGGKQRSPYMVLVRKRVEQPVVVPNFVDSCVAVGAAPRPDLVGVAWWWQCVGVDEDGVGSAALVEQVRKRCIPQVFHCTDDDRQHVWFDMLCSYGL